MVFSVDRTMVKAQHPTNGFCLRPCMDFGKSVCNNRSGEFAESDGIWSYFDSPSKIGVSFNELVRMKALQQQRFVVASQFIASSGGQHHILYTKYMNILNNNMSF